MAGEGISEAGDSLIEKIKKASPGAKLAIGIGIVGILVTIYFATARTRAASSLATTSGTAGGIGGSLPVDGTSGASGGDQFGLFPAGPPSGGTTGTTGTSGTSGATPPRPILPTRPTLPSAPQVPAHPLRPPILAPGPSGGVNVGDFTHIRQTASGPAPSASHPAVSWAAKHPTSKPKPASPVAKRLAVSRARVDAADKRVTGGGTKITYHTPRAVPSGLF